MIFFDSYDSYNQNQQKIQWAVDPGFKLDFTKYGMLFFKYHFGPDQFSTIVRTEDQNNNIVAVISPYSKKTGAFDISFVSGIQNSNELFHQNFIYHYYPDDDYALGLGDSDFDKKSHHGFTYALTANWKLRKSLLALESFYHYRFGRGYYISALPQWHYAINDNLNLLVGSELPIYAGNKYKFFVGIYYKKKDLPKKPILNATVFSESDSLILEHIDKKIEYIPLLNVIFFENYSHKLNPLKKMNPITSDKYAEIIYDVLNYVGDRLADNPKVNIILKGYCSDFQDNKQNLNLAKERAESVKKFLFENYKIQSSQIITEADILPSNPSSSEVTMGREENQRVEILSTSTDFFIPLKISHTDNILNLKDLQFNIHVNHSEDIDRWSLSIFDQNKMIIRSFNGENTPPSNLIWDFKNDKNEELWITSDLRFLYQLNVQDIKGNRFITPESSLDIVLSEDLYQSEETIFRLTLFNFNDFNVDSKQIQKELDHIVKKMIEEPNSTLTIKGYTDIIGDSEYNFRLSEKRAEQVMLEILKRGISKHRITCKGYGQVDPLMSNETPEGRFLNRRVELILKNQIKGVRP